jgi:putative two-component system response regulator
MSATRQRRELWSEPGASDQRVLVVDDDRQVQEVLARLLQSRGYETVCVGDAEAACARVGEESFQVVLCDVRLPGQSGLELAQRLAADAPQVAVVMVSGVDDHEVAETALEVGAYDYVVKPFTPNEVFVSVANALRRRALDLHSDATKRQLAAALEQQRGALVDAAAALAWQQDMLQRARRETLFRLARAAEVRNESMGNHMERVGLYSKLLAQRLGLENERCEALGLASPLHDIGKIGLPDEILLKPGPLDADERLMMQGHTEIGYCLLADKDDPLLELAAAIALTHHEHLDGSGYPRGLLGDEVTIESRIVSVADAFDAMTSNRPYRAALSVDESCNILAEHAGAQFDRDVVSALITARALFAASTRHLEATATHTCLPHLEAV